MRIGYFALIVPEQALCYSASTYVFSHPPMNIVREFSIDRWDMPIDPSQQNEAVGLLESGQVLFFPHLAFQLLPGEQRFLTPEFSDGKSKNISLSDAALKGARGTPDELAALQAMVARFAAQAAGLVSRLFPAYGPHLLRARTSYRPFEVEQRVSSYKKDDKRLHVDAFPSRPTHGERILRVFANVNPEGRPRVWRVGEPFEDLAQRYLPRIPKPVAGAAWLMERLGITKSRRSEYDHIMLHLHDMMKGDTVYQKTAPQQEVALPPGCVWIVFSDQVLHAAMSGQYMFEQTFHLPVAGLVNPDTSPLRVLERLTGRSLVAI